LKFFSLCFSPWLQGGKKGKYNPQKKISNNFDMSKNTEFDTDLNQIKKLVKGS
jgi:hypothetical protein